MTRHWLLIAPLFTCLGCGPDKRPEEPCDGPSFNLVVTAQDAPLPDDTRIVIRYGSNQRGEAYKLGQQATSQAVFCEEDVTPVGDGSGGAPDAEAGVRALRCRLYTQGPARLDATATGYQPIEDHSLSFEDKPYCQVEVEVELKRELPDAGS